MSSSPDSPATYFAPAGRDLPSELNRRRLVIEATPLLQETIDAMSDSVVILNNCRQILTANRRLLETLDCHKTVIIGRRPGELLGLTFCPAPAKMRENFTGPALWQELSWAGG